jgi:DNA mismatch repair protein MSH6
MAKAVTPNKSTMKGNGGGSSGKKQQSLMSFFKPASKTPKPASSPLQVLNDSRNIASSSPLKRKLTTSKDTSGSTSDKENDSFEHMSEDESQSTTILDTPQDNTKILTDTPLSSDIDVSPKKELKTNLPRSSPVKETGKRSKPRVSYEESDNEEDPIVSGRKKRKLIQSDSDSEDDFKLASDHLDDDDMSDFVVDDDASESEPEAKSDEDNTEDLPKPKKTPKKSCLKPLSTPNSKSTNLLGGKFDSGSSYTPSGKPTPTQKSSPFSKTTPKKNFAKENEERYQWLVDVRDAEKRPQDHPEYDSRTLHIPQSAWTKFTPFEKQYWEIKSKMWNTVVFFKKGKFYELYENDAIIANTEFDLKIAGGGRANMKLAGIPEMSFEYWAKEFISHGYKVAKVDQSETLLAKQMRGGGTKEEKVIRRELTGILTGGTLTDLNMISDDMAIYCLSIKEESSHDGGKIFGVAFVDTATSELNMIEFEDDAECTKLDTVVTQIKPKEIICEKGNLCSTATKIIKFNSHSTNQIWNNLNPISEFWDYDITLENLVKAKYYEATDLDDYSKFPEILINFKDNHKIAFNAFGGLLSYLTSLKLDRSILTLANIHEYDIARSSSSTLILDGITLNNLEILNNSFDGTEKGTLFKLLNRAITPFGKRSLKNWIIYPLMNVKDINQRYDSIDWLMNDGTEFRSYLEQGLTGLPDLERLLARVHSNALRFKDFLKVVESFESVSKLFIKLQAFVTTNCGVLYEFLRNYPPEVDDCLKEWEDAFDRIEAIKDIIVPAKGVDEAFDLSQSKLDSLESQLEIHLKNYKKQYKSHEICYKDSGKEVYLIEMPNKLSKSVPHDWQQMGSTNKVKRYWSPEVKTLVQELLEQRELHKLVCDNLKSNIYKKFDAHYSVWKKVINTISNIDCLLSLTKTSETIGYPSCRPEFVESETGQLSFTELRHPCFAGTKEFIPNDVTLGGLNPKFGLLTGANAAGKSTLMRTTALAVIMSQIGCYIPASLARLTPVDKIMTRLGANDNIMQGKSTFFVELSETKKILSNATTKSLVILDELGRGGSSSDGYAIAESVLYHLSTHVQSMGFFATHYGTLGMAFKNHPQIVPLRMAIIVDGKSRKITFLHKLEGGAALGSFGMNVAAMCGIQESIVEQAEVAAKEYEQTSKLKREDNKIIDQNMILGLQSDVSWIVNNNLCLDDQVLNYRESIKQDAMKNIFEMIQ